MIRARTFLLVLLPLALACDGEEIPGAADATDTPAALGENFPVIAATCDDLPDAEALRRYAMAAPDSVEPGGMFHGQHEWAAAVNRAGMLCALVVAADSVGELWPGSRNIAMAKAFTANGFSTTGTAMSTARLYTMAQPGRSLYGAFVANPFDPECLDPEIGTGTICGGTIAFGGGLPLYDADGELVGGLGLSGDTPCADHEVAKVVRALAGLMPPQGNFVDDITYAVVDGPSVYTHPLCENTWRNGERIGDAAPADAYPQDLPPARVPGPAPGRPDRGTSVDTLPPPDTVGAAAPGR